MNLWRLYDKRKGYRVYIRYRLAEAPSWIRKKKAFQDIKGVIEY